MVLGTNEKTNLFNSANYHEYTFIIVAIIAFVLLSEVKLSCLFRDKEIGMIKDNPNRTFHRGSPVARSKT